MTPLRSLLALVLLFSAASQAEAQIGRICDIRDPQCRDNTRRPDPSPYDPIPGRPGRPDRPNPPSYPGNPNNPGNPGYPGNQMGRREVVINRHMSNERMDLANFLFQGDLLESVDVFVGFRSRDFANIGLMVNRMIDDSRSTSGGMITLFPRRPVRIDRFGDLVQLDVQGFIFIERLVLNYRQGNGGGYPPPPNQPPGYGDFELNQNVFRNFNGQNQIDLQQLMPLHQYRGMRVISVTVVGTSARGFGEVEIMTNGFSQDRRTLATYTTFADLQVRSLNRIGQDMGSLILRTQGNIFIERIIIRVARY
ncbi:MAG: hypothetical protein BroJett040_18670 [Oligoflexia bacterium]|nr:MAG: hypothetical protein BroJett040_18670 [Oligoflexia bacterium]